MAGQDDYNSTGEPRLLASALAAAAVSGLSKLITEHMEASQAAHQGLTPRNKPRFSKPLKL